MLFDYCYPPKADHPEVEKYLVLLKTVVKSRRDLLQACNQDGDTPLFRAAEKGSLDHVKYFLRGCRFSVMVRLVATTNNFVKFGPIFIHFKWSY